MTLATQACRDAGLPVVGPEDCTCRLRGRLVVLARADGLRVLWPYDQRCPVHDSPTTHNASHEPPQRRNHTWVRH